MGEEEESRALKKQFQKKHFLTIYWKNLRKNGNSGGGVDYPPGGIMAVKWKGFLKVKPGACHGTKNPAT
jgi:hypothetical protein